MEKNKKQKGFSIPEVIVAISMVTIVIMTATNLLVSSMRANRTNINNIIGYNLAQEAIEGFRNVRDGNWRHNQDWRGSEKMLMGDNFIGGGNFIIDRNDTLFDQASCISREARDLNNVTTVQTYAPWNLKTLGLSDPETSDQTKLYLSNYEGDINVYRHDSTRNAEETIYRRWLEVQEVPVDYIDSINANEFKVVVTAIVQWEEQSRIKEIRIPTIFTNWKDGPL